MPLSLDGRLNDLFSTADFPADIPSRCILPVYPSIPCPWGPIVPISYEVSSLVILISSRRQLHLRRRSYQHLSYQPERRDEKRRGGWWDEGELGTISKVAKHNRKMLTRTRLPAKIPCHKYNINSFLLTKNEQDTSHKWYMHVTWYLDW